MQVRTPERAHVSPRVARRPSLRYLKSAQKCTFLTTSLRTRTLSPRRSSTRVNA